ncbi:hypothetical protein B9Z19DRAFT_1086144 [Tuber borchii]|uniref:Secreted protein n=1 Tax=Tuber borchii TaxID=42251 RepID=A0A2T6ZPV6_TUBBO|nr:hypothetical protein B9Z19DRAFT_1086144 [Tuber borchii]
MFFIFYFLLTVSITPPPLPIVEASLDSLWFYLVTLPFADASALLTGAENHTSGMQARFHLNCPPCFVLCNRGTSKIPTSCNPNRSCNITRSTLPHLPTPE